MPIKVKDWIMFGFKVEFTAKSGHFLFSDGTTPPPKPTLPLLQIQDIFIYFKLYVYVVILFCPSNTHLLFSLNNPDWMPCQLSGVIHISPYCWCNKWIKWNEITRETHSNRIDDNVIKQSPYWPIPSHVKQRRWMVPISYEQLAPLVKCKG